MRFLTPRFFTILPHLGTLFICWNVREMYCNSQNYLAIFPTWPSFPLNACSTQDRLHILKICHLSLRSRYLLNLCTQVSTEPPPPHAPPFWLLQGGSSSSNQWGGGGLYLTRGSDPRGEGTLCCMQGSRKTWLTGWTSCYQSPAYRTLCCMQGSEKHG